MNELILRRREDSRRPPCRISLLFKSLEIEIATPNSIATPVLVRWRKFAEGIQTLHIRPIRSSRDHPKTIIMLIYRSPRKVFLRLPHHSASIKAIAKRGLKIITGGHLLYHQLFGLGPSSSTIAPKATSCISCSKTMASLTHIEISSHSKSNSSHSLRSCVTSPRRLRIRTKLRSKTWTVWWINCSLIQRHRHHELSPTSDRHCQLLITVLVRWTITSTSGVSS